MKERSEKSKLVRNLSQLKDKLDDEGMILQDQNLQTHQLAEENAVVSTAILRNCLIIISFHDCRDYVNILYTRSTMCNFVYAYM